MSHLGLESLVLEKFRGRVEILSTHNLSEICNCPSDFCRKFAVSAGKLQLSVPPTVLFFIHDAVAEQ